jgi:hypothetical protein
MKMKIGKHLRGNNDSSRRSKFYIATGCELPVLTDRPRVKGRIENKVYILIARQTQRFEEV